MILVWGRREWSVFGRRSPSHICSACGMFLSHEWFSAYGKWLLSNFEILPKGEPEMAIG